MISGGGLAAATALLARDRGGMDVAHTLNEIPRPLPANHDSVGWTRVLTSPRTRVARVVLSARLHGAASVTAECWGHGRRTAGKTTENA